MHTQRAVQVPACDGCSVGVMDATNQHLLGTCWCSCHREYTAGQEVAAFHPRMFGVVKTGTVVTVGRQYLHVDFGELLGGTFKVPYKHVP